MEDRWRRCAKINIRPYLARLSKPEDNLALTFVLRAISKHRISVFCDHGSVIQFFFRVAKPAWKSSPSSMLFMESIQLSVQPPIIGSSSFAVAAFFYEPRPAGLKMATTEETVKKP